MRSGKRSRWLASLLGTVLATSACLGGASEQNNSDTVVVAASGEPAQLNALYFDGPTDLLPIWSINQGLLKISREGELEPVLAAKLPEPVQGDPLRWRLQLRKGIQFTNGEPFDAAAIKANVEAFLHPEDPALADTEARSGLITLKGAEVVDKDTIDFVTESPDAVFPWRLTYLKMVPPEAMTKPGYSEHPVGTGPYVFESWSRGQEIVLRANRDYWDDEPKPEIDKVVIRFTPEASTRVSALQAGEVDLAQGLTPDQVKQAPQAIYSATPVEAQIFRLNLNTPPLTDANFRRALNYAIDKQALNRAMFGGQFEPLPCQAVGRESAGFNPSLEPYPYNPKKARELLAKVDIPADFQLELHMDNGSLNAQVREVGQAVAAYFKDVGIKVRPVFNDTASYIEGLQDTAPETAVDAVYSTTDNPYNSAMRYVSTYVAPEGTTSTVGSEYPQLQSLYEEALRETDQQQREQILNKITRVACEDSFFIFLLYKKPAWGASDRVVYEPGYGELERFEFARLRLRK